MTALLEIILWVFSDILSSSISSYSASYHPPSFGWFSSSYHLIVLVLIIVFISSGYVVLRKFLNLLNIRFLIYEDGWQTSIDLLVKYIMQCLKGIYWCMIYYMLGNWYVFIIIINVVIIIDSVHKQHSN